MTAARRTIAIRLGTLATTAMPQTAYADVLGNGASLAVSPWRVIASLLLCLALGAAAIFPLRRRYGLGQGSLLRATTERRIRVIEQQGLGPHRSVSLIEIDRQAYVALIAPGSATLVALERPAPKPETDPA
jgi:flagellar biogenesis protein FliO